MEARDRWSNGILAMGDCAHFVPVDGLAVYHNATRWLLLANEVNGIVFHKGDPAQPEHGTIKKSVLGVHGVDVLELPANGSGKESCIRSGWTSPPQQHEDF